MAAITHRPQCTPAHDTLHLAPLLGLLTQRLLPFGQPIINSVGAVAGPKERRQIRNVGPYAPQLLILGRHRGERRPPRFHLVSHKSDVKPA